MGLAEEAEYFRVGLAVGLLTMDDVVAWADAVIAQDDGVPSLEMIDVALGSKLPRHEMVTLLRTAAGGQNDGVKAAHRVLGLLRAKMRAGEVDTAAAASMLKAYSQWANVSDWERKDADNLGMFWDEAVEGYYGTVEGVRRDMEQFLDRCGDA